MSLAAEPGVNSVRLAARLVERGGTRYTPAGLEALDLVLEHQGEAHEAGGLRKVSLTMRAVAFGPLAARLTRLALGSGGVFEGFLAPSRNGRGIVLHLSAAVVSAPDE